MFKEWLPADHTTLVPNPNYWGGKPKISELVFKPVPEAERSRDHAGEWAGRRR